MLVTMTARGTALSSTLQQLDTESNQYSSVRLSHTESYCNYHTVKVASPPKGKMRTWLRDGQFSASCVAPNMVGAMTVCPVLGVIIVKHFQHEK